MRVGFVSTRFAGTDGVSLETWKWVDVLTDWGHEAFFFAGEVEAPEERAWVVPEAHFKHPRIQAVHQALFVDLKRSPALAREVQDLKTRLKEALHAFVQSKGIDVLVAENALSLPMNVPLGLALTEFIAETGIPAVGHHHDFYWERPRFLRNVASDYLRAAFPPVLPTLQHVVINSLARQHLARFAGVAAMVIPNVMDFENPPPPPDDYAQDLRDELDIPPDAFFILQPTRIVPRKRIEQAIELVRRLDLPAVLVISHASGDEGDAYARYLREYAAMLGVPVRFAADRVAAYRGRDAQGRKIYSLADLYQHADLVTYPSSVEGFGNAFLEAVYYKRPIVANAYTIFRLDIQPKGFQVVTFSEFIDDATVRDVRHLLLHPERVQDMVEHNYRLGTQYFSMRILRQRLAVLFHMCTGCDVQTCP